MGQIKGKSGNLNGRPKGVQNKVTKEVKEHIAKFVEGKFEEFMESFDAIKKPEIKARVYLEVVKLILPKPKSKDEEEESNRRAREILDRIWPINREK